MCVALQCVTCGADWGTVTPNVTDKTIQMVSTPWGMKTFWLVHNDSVPALRADGVYRLSFSMRFDAMTLQPSNLTSFMAGLINLDTSPASVQYAPGLLDTSKVRVHAITPLTQPRRAPA
jgi:hypothetical protein